MLIYCTTARTGVNEFEFERIQYIGLSDGEVVTQLWTDADNDRLRAAIVNIGFACRGLSETQTRIKIVGIESDVDGKDKRYGGEHDILFSLLAPKDDFKGRKQRSLYFEYERYLSRIKTLQLQNDIRFVLQDKNDIVRYN